jgi:hypothetical protein
MFLRWPANCFTGSAKIGWYYLWGVNKLKKYLMVGLMLVAGWSHAALINSSADPALGGGSIIDFSGIATQNASSFTVGGVTFSTTTGTLRVAPFGEGGSGWLGSGQMLTTRDTTGTSSFSIIFSTAVSAFGMDWGAANPSWNVSLFDSLDNLLESVVFVGGNAGASFSEFYGASHTGISRVELTSVSGYDWVIIDDFTFVTDDNGSVPEPATALLVGLALAGLGVARRRR